MVCCTWDLPRTRIELVSVALQGGFLTTGPPGKPQFPFSCSALLHNILLVPGFAHSSIGKKICLQCRKPGFYSWVRKIPWRGKWQPTPVFLPGESQGQRTLAGASPWGHKSWTQLSNETTTSSRRSAPITVHSICIAGHRGHCI